ncbi:MAG: HAMP domain-containing histidine kinase [Clostridiales bacterium]|nr:HAMP domain-containing histidine kinase [Clostridiales bacterium]
MKYLLMGLTLLLALLGIIFYNNMMHFACIVSLILALICGCFFALYLNAQYVKNLEKLERLRKRLTSDVAHELRTPLTAVSVSLEAIAEGALEPTLERISKCYDEIQRLSKLVADMENLAKTESDILRLNKTPIDLLELARDVFGNAEGVSVTINADRERLTQVLTNLRTNAEKHGGGEIIVTVREIGKYGEITVTDNGDGISPKDLPHIFERFYRADKSRSRATGGAGIGLAVVRMIVDAHGGSVNVKSEVGRGSDFIVKLIKYHT